MDFLHPPLDPPEAPPEGIAIITKDGNVEILIIKLYEAGLSFFVTSFFLE